MHLMSMLLETLPPVLIALSLMSCSVTFLVLVLLLTSLVLVPLLITLVLAPHVVALVPVLLLLVFLPAPVVPSLKVRRSLTPCPIVRVRFGMVGASTGGDCGDFHVWHEMAAP